MTLPIGNSALQRLVSAHEPLETGDLWDQAVAAAWNQPVMRSSLDAEPGERMAHLRDSLRGELVAFHKRLPVRLYAGTDLSALVRAGLVQVDIPVTLFPKRDQGFTGWSASSS